MKGGTAIEGLRRTKDTLTPTEKGPFRTPHIALCVRGEAYLIVKPFTVHTNGRPEEP